MFHVSGRSLPQKRQTKSSSRTVLCSRRLGHRRNTVLTNYLDRLADTDINRPVVRAGA
ncbi:hypothetical protein [Embleya hyalina]|uniref:hypothetical protein n=1 Tax=Embleya hyalina TaxID=516124 RepID=UPI001476A30C|nr:hypothetical protein [Embleya hyalina]